MKDNESIVEWFAKLLALDEAKFLFNFHQAMENFRKKSWHDKYIKIKSFALGDQVLLYNSKYQKHPGKLKMHCLKPFIVA
jgi:hypothetical protein